MSQTKADPNKKTHWFLMGFMVPSPGQWRPVSFYGSYTNRILTLNATKAIREAQGVPEDAVLLNVSYIGYASLHTIRGTSDEIVPTKLSDAYRQGLIAANTPNMTGKDFVNPYEEFSSASREMQIRANEWAEGYAEGCHVRETVKMNALSNVNPAPVIET